MNNAVINIKIKKELKSSAQKIAADLGLSLSAILNAYLRQFVRNEAVYFNTAPVMTNELENLIIKAEYDIQRGKNLSQPLRDKKELNNYLTSL